MSYFGIGVYHTKSEVNIGTLMRSAYCFGAHYVFTIGKRYKRQSSDTVDARNQIPCYHFESMEEFHQHLPIGCRIVGVELGSRSHPLTNYVHPANCVYLLGAEDHGIPPKDLAKCHEVVEIPGAKHCLNVASAGSIVLYDRIAKGSPHRRPVEFHNEWQVLPFAS